MEHLKKTLLLLLSWVFCVCVSQAGELTLPSLGGSELQVPASMCDKRLLLRVRARLQLPVGAEAWGGYFLGMRLNDAELPDPVNTPAYVVDFCRLPAEKTPLYCTELQRWFVRADSDYIAFNAQEPGTIYNREAFLSNANSQSEVSNYQNAYYDKVFSLPAKHVKGALALKNYSPAYSMHLQVDFLSSSDENCLFFTPDPGRLIKRGSFPSPEEMCKELRWQASPGERLAILIAARSLEKEECFDYELSSWVNDDGQRLDKDFFDIRILSYKKPVNPQIPEEYLHYASFEHTAAEQPDRLIVEKQWKIPAKECSLMWIIAKIPENTLPGEYRSSLRLNDAKSLPLKLEVLPLKLQKSQRIYGLWTNSLPGSKPEARKLQCQDLREHGINTFFLDPWTVPVTLNEDGSPRLQRFQEALQWLNEEGFNQKVLVYGILGPLLKAIQSQAGKADPENIAWRELAAKVFCPMQELASKEGFDLYLHPYDEPDVHPKITDSFVQLCLALKSIPELKVASNISASGQKRFSQLLDLNICNSGYQALLAKSAFPNPFFPQWEAAEPDWIKDNVNYVYTQVRAQAGLDARLLYGLGADAAGLKGVWGFAYHWNQNKWYIAWPHPELDGSCGSTYAWEMLSTGIFDTQYWLSLKKLRPELKLPDTDAMLNISAEELAIWRREIISALLSEDYQPNLSMAKSVQEPYNPLIQAGRPDLTEGLKELEFKSYKVYPGNVYKHFWNRSDRDWLDSSDAGQRQGLLTKASAKSLPQTLLCYNFWRCDPAESYISILLELAAASELQALRVEGANPSKMYTVSHATLHDSLDAMTFGKASVSFGPDPELNGSNWSITMPGCGKTKYVLLTIWTGANNYLNIKKVTAFGKTLN